MNQGLPAIPRVYIGPKAGFRGIPGAAARVSEAVRAAGGEVSDTLEDANAIVWLSGAGGEELKSRLHPGIAWLQLPSAGIEHLIKFGIMEENRIVTGGHAAYAPAVAEMALAHMLAASRGLHEYARRRTWRSDVDRLGKLLRPGTRVLVIGAGGIGGRLIELLVPFGVTSIAVTRSGRIVPHAAQSFAADALPRLWGTADYYVLAAPATTETEHLIGKRQLAIMGSQAWIVNVGRGKLIDTDALVTALESGTIAGAGLDVVDPEPLPDYHPLWSAPGALISPRVANPASDHFREFVNRVGENTRRLIAGVALLGVVRPELGY